MPSSTIRETIIDFFNTGWANRAPVVMENRDYTPPSTANWLRVQVNDNLLDQITLGDNPCYRCTGFVGVTVSVPENSGTKVSRAFTDEVIKIFVNKQAGNITFRNIQKRELGVDDGFYKTYITVDFYGDESVSSITA